MRSEKVWIEWEGGGLSSVGERRILINIRLFVCKKTEYSVCS